jgi:hypothetical protein
MVRGVPRFTAFDTSSLRSASSSARLPWLGRSVTLLRVDATGVVEQAKSDSEKRALLETSTSKDLVLVCPAGVVEPRGVCGGRLARGARRGSRLSAAASATPWARMLGCGVRAARGASIGDSGLVLIQPSCCKGADRHLP